MFQMKQHPSARNIFFVLFASAMVGGCAQTVLSPSALSRAPSEGNQSQTCGVWTSFEGLSLIDGSGAKQSQGTLSCAKKAVIFVHGMTAGTPTSFQHSELWRAAGFNTFVFEWVELAQGNPIEIFTSNTEKAAAKLVLAVKKLEQQIEDLDLQLVGHSFGSKVSIEAAVELARPLQLLPAFQNRNLSPAAKTSPTPQSNTLQLAGTAADL